MCTHKFPLQKGVGQAVPKQGQSEPLQSLWREGYLLTRDNPVGQSIALVLPLPLPRKQDKKGGYIAYLKSKVFIKNSSHHPLPFGKYSEKGINFVIRQIKSQIQYFTVLLNLSEPNFSLLEE